MIADTEKISLFVGAIGHRDIVDASVAEIRTRISTELSRIEDAANGLRLVLLSGLAEGGDQILAEEALKRGWDVLAVFPMPFADYLADFKTDYQREALIKLKDRCSASVEIAWLTRLDPDISSPRDQQYRKQSQYIARQSQLVVALWDGSPAVTAGACGTAYAVTLCRDGALPPVEGELLAAPETTPLIHIPVRRSSSPGPNPVVQPIATAGAADLRTAREFGAYSGAVAKFRNGCPQQVRLSQEWLISGESRDKVNDETRTLIEHYAVADAMARDRQNKRNLAVKLASVATVFGAFAQATNSLLSQSSWMICYGVAVGLAYGLYVVLFLLPFFRIEDRYLEYRALAEAIRVQIAWRIAGISKVAAEHYLQLVKTEVGWVRELLRSISLDAMSKSSNTPSDLELAKQFWVDGQANYFVGKNPARVEGKALESKKLRGRFDLAANAALGIGAVLVAIAGAATLYPVPAGIKAAASAYSASFFLTAGIIRGYVSCMGYAEQAINYEKLGIIFRGVQQLFGHPQAVRDEHLFALGKQALAENANWLLQHRKNAFKIKA